MNQENLSVKLKASQRMNAVLGSMVLGLGVAVSVLGVTAANKQSEVVLVPTLASELAVREGAASREYLEQMTRDVASLFLNRTPHNTEYFEDTLLRLVDPRVYASMQAELEDARAERVETRTSTVFHPIELYVEPDRGYSEIVGEVQTFVGDERISKETKTFAATWAVNGLTVRLHEFVEIDPSERRAD